MGFGPRLSSCREIQKGVGLDAVGEDVAHGVVRFGERLTADDDLRRGDVLRIALVLKLGHKVFLL
jgi:hypothetical protein